MLVEQLGHFDVMGGPDEELGAGGGDGGEEGEDEEEEYEGEKVTIDRTDETFEPTSRPAFYINSV